jgi:hypothetical protein
MCREKNVEVNPLIEAWQVVLGYLLFGKRKITPLFCLEPAY